MNFENKVQMSISDVTKFWNDESYEFAYGTVDFLSNRPNSHNHTYPEEVIKEYAPSIINKWVVAEYSKTEGDVTSHTDNQKIVGIVPQQEVKYRYDEDGYIIASVDIVMSKIYATDVYEIFKSNNKRSVSVELMLGFTDETKNIPNGFGEKIVTGFNIVGVTVLGLAYNPSVPNANIQMTRMSECESEYVKYVEQAKDGLESEDKMSEILNKLSEIDRKLSKEEKMAKDIKEEVVEETLSEEVVEETMEEEVEEATEKEEMSEEPNTETEEEEMAESEEEVEEEEMACGDKEKYAELETKLEEANSKIAEYETQIAQLSEFKEKVEAEECKKIVAETLSIAKKVVEEEKYTELEKEAEECVYNTVGEWSTKTLASVSQMAIAKMEEFKNSEMEDGVMDMGLPTEPKKEKTCIYD